MTVAMITCIFQPLWLIIYGKLEFKSTICTHTHTHTVVLLNLSFIIHYYMVRVYTLIAGHVVTIVMYTITIYA